VSVTQLDSPETSVAVGCMVDAIGTLLSARVLGMVLSDGVGVSVMPLPATALDLFDFLGSVDWKRVRAEASEHFV